MMSSEWKRYNHTCEEYDEGEELASPFLRFCPIGVKVIQAEYIQNNTNSMILYSFYIIAPISELLLRHWKIRRNGWDTLTKYV